MKIENQLRIATVKKMLVFVLAFIPFVCLAAQPLGVVINEICWMGTEVSANDEWIELYNNTDNIINLDGWKLIAQDEMPEIPLKGEIPAGDFFLLERTDDDSVPQIPADLIYKGALNNQGEHLQLKDGEGMIIDETNCLEVWFAGNNETKQTMQRINPSISGNNPGNWGTSENPNDTPKANNGVEKKPYVAPSPEPAKEVRLQPTVYYADNIVLNEILPSPEGADNENEYIEIFNQNGFEVDMSGWILQDTAGAVKTFVFPEKTKILAKNFLTFCRPQTKITLNNSGDEIKLLKPNQKLADKIYYEKASRGESFNKTGDNWAWSIIPTPGAENVILEEKRDEKEKPRKVGGATSDQEGNALEIRGEELLAGLSGVLSDKNIQEKISKNFIFVFLIALFMAIFSSILFLLLKIKIKKS